MSFYKEAKARNLLELAAEKIMKRKKKYKGGNIIVDRLGPFDEDIQRLLAGLRKGGHKQFEALLKEHWELIHSSPLRKFGYVPDANIYLVLCPGVIDSNGNIIHHPDCETVVHVKPQNMREKFRSDKCNSLFNAKSKDPDAALNALNRQLDLAVFLGNGIEAAKLRKRIKEEKKK